MVFRVVNLLRVSSPRNRATLARIFHQTALLSQKKEMPEGRYTDVMPNGEEVYSEPKASCGINKRVAKSPSTESANSRDIKKPKSPFNLQWEMYVDKKYVQPVVQWEFPKNICCPPCDAYRFDVHYYTPTNKNRTYQRTWWECTPRMVPKRVCCWCDAVPPHVERRTQEELQLERWSACTAAHEKKRMEILDKKSKGCPRLQVPYCRTARIPPSCKIFQAPTDSKKVRCPFPSFSECLQEEPAVIPGRPPECKCLDHNPICIQIRRAQHMAQHNISLFPCGRGEKEAEEE